MSSFMLHLCLLNDNFNKLKKTIAPQALPVRTNIINVCPIYMSSRTGGATWRNSNESLRLFRCSIKKRGQVLVKHFKITVGFRSNLKKLQSGFGQTSKNYSRVSVKPQKISVGSEQFLIKKKKKNFCFKRSKV